MDSLLFISLLHWFISVIPIIYIICFPSTYDPIAITLTLLLFSHWCFLNGECVISFLYKKLKDGNYKAGQEVLSMDDMGINNKFLKILLHVNETIAIIIILIVFYRNRNLFPFANFIIILVAMFTYVISLRLNNKVITNISGISMLTLIVISYIIYIKNLLKK